MSVTNCFKSDTQKTARDFLKAARKEKGYKQGDIAKACGISIGAYCNIEK